MVCVGALTPRGLYCNALLGGGGNLPGRHWPCIPWLLHKVPQETGSEYLIQASPTCLLWPNRTAKFKPSKSVTKRAKSWARNSHIQTGPCRAEPWDVETRAQQTRGTTWPPLPLSGRSARQKWKWTCRKWNSKTCPSGAKKKNVYKGEHHQTQPIWEKLTYRKLTSMEKILYTQLFNTCPWENRRQRRK